MGDSELQAQLRADPRVQAIVQQRRTGGLSDAELRQLGYQVPDGYHYVFGGRAGMGTLMDNERGLMEKAAPIAAIGMGTLAGVGALGGIPGIAGIGAGAAPSTAASAGAAGSTTGLAGSTATTAGGLLPSASLPAAGLMGGPGAVASQGITSGAGGGGFLSSLIGGFKEDPLGSIGRMGDMLGKGAAGAAQGRRDDSYAMANAGRVNLDALALDQKRAALRSLLGGLQDATIGRPAGSTIPNFSVQGGLRPSALSNKDALMAELGRPSPVVPMPTPGTGEKVMGGAGMIGGILGALGKPKFPPVMNQGGY